MWILRFANGPAAAAFAAAYGRSVEPQVDVEVRGRLVVTPAGSPAFRDAFEERVEGK